jgi:molybdopterin/thiamine biosynthesis adenylyltransferase
MKTVVIVGVGALGSHVALLGRNWEAHLRVIDFDKVESKNVQAQFHTNMGLGKNKAVALEQAMKGMFKRQLVRLPVKLMGKNVEELLGRSDLVIDCTDNFKARDIIQEYCTGSRKVDCLHCCLSADGQFARIVWTEHFKPDKEDVDGQVTCEDGGFLPFYAQAAAVAVQVAGLYLDLGVKQSWQLTPFSVVRLT